MKKIFLILILLALTVIKEIKERYNRLGISKDIYKDGITVTADTGKGSETLLQVFSTASLGANAFSPVTGFP